MSAKETKRMGFYRAQQLAEEAARVIEAREASIARTSAMAEAFERAANRVVRQQREPMGGKLAAAFK